MVRRERPPQNLRREYKNHILVLIFTLGYLLLFTTIAFYQNNYEFLFYSLIISLLIVFILNLHNRFFLPLPIVIGLSLGGLFHVLGGTLIIDGVRLYDVYLIGQIFRYDNFVHVFNSFVATLITYNLLSRQFVSRHHQESILLPIVLILFVAGLGTVNELVEFGAVIFLDAAETVGGYYNTSLDLVFNFVGAICASVLIQQYHKRRLRSAEFT